MPRKPKPTVHPVETISAEVQEPIRASVRYLPQEPNETIPPLIVVYLPTEAPNTKPNPPTFSQTFRPMWPGTPAEKDGPPPYSITANLTVSQWHRLEDFASSKGRNRGEILGSAIDEYLITHAAD